MTKENINNVFTHSIKKDIRLKSGYILTLDVSIKREENDTPDIDLFLRTSSDNGIYIKIADIDELKDIIEDIVSIQEDVKNSPVYKQNLIKTL